MSKTIRNASRDANALTDAVRDVAPHELHNVAGAITGINFIGVGAAIGEHCGRVPDKQLYPPPPTVCWW